MIIHPPEIIDDSSSSILFARFESESGNPALPEHLWFRVPREFRSAFSLQSDPFLILGVLWAIYHHEDIQVLGQVSPRLAYLIEEYQHQLATRHPDVLRPVKITINERRSVTQPGEMVGAFFSGGVDSMFTLWKQNRDKEVIPGFLITHVIFTNGFNNSLNTSELYQLIAEIYKRNLEKIGVTLLPLETNMTRLVVPEMEYLLLFGPLLNASAHALGGMFSRVFIPSSYSLDQTKARSFIWDNLSDPYTSTDYLDIIHHGTEYSWANKIAAFSDWEFAWHNLRVCFGMKSPSEVFNCSRCEKCIRTMIPLYAEKKLFRFTTFEKPFTKDIEGLWVGRKINQNGYPFLIENIKFVRSRNKSFARWMLVGVFLGTLRLGIIKLIPNWGKDFLKRFGFFDREPRQSEDFENPEVLLAISQR